MEEHKRNFMSSPARPSARENCPGNSYYDQRTRVHHLQEFTLYFIHGVQNRNPQIIFFYLKLVAGAHIYGLGEKITFKTKELTNN